MALYTVRTAEPPDWAALLALNNSEVPHVSELTPDSWQALVAESLLLRVAITPGDQAAGFILAMNERAKYASPNFLWFQARYPRFTYVDRIVIAAEHRRQGLGQLLYSDLERLTGDAGPLTCEVNLRPPNPGSIDFHRRVGFTEVGTQDTDGGKKTVCLMAKRR